MPDDLVQARGDLAERAVLDGVDQLREDVAAAAHDFFQTSERTLRLPRVLFPERAQPANLEKLLRPRRALDGERARQLRVFGVAVQPDDGPRAVVDLPLVSVRGLLNLAALVTLLDRGDHAAEPVHLAQ